MHDYLQRGDAALEFRYVLQLPHSRSLRRLPVGQYPASNQNFIISLMAAVEANAGAKASYIVVKMAAIKPHLLTLLGSTMGSGPVPGLYSTLQALCASAANSLFIAVWWSEDAAGLSSLMLLWSDGVDGLEDARGNAAPAEEDDGGGTSSENMDSISWSSSRRSNSPAALASSASGASRKAMESLTERRWEPRLAEEKSRNSSIHEGWELGAGGEGVGRDGPAEAGMEEEGGGWWPKLGQVGWKLVGILGGS